MKILHLIKTIAVIVLFFWILIPTNMMAMTTPPKEEPAVVEPPPPCPSNHTFLECTTSTGWKNSICLKANLVTKTYRQFLNPQGIYENRLATEVTSNETGQCIGGLAKMTSVTTKANNYGYIPASIIENAWQIILQEYDDTIEIDSPFIMMDPIVGKMKQLFDKNVANLNYYRQQGTVKSETKYEYFAPKEQTVFQRRASNTNYTDTLRLEASALLTPIPEGSMNVEVIVNASFKSRETGYVNINSFDSCTATYNLFETPVILTIYPVKEKLRMFYTKEGMNPRTVYSCKTYFHPVSSGLCAYEFDHVENPYLDGALPFIYCEDEEDGQW